MNNFKIIKRGYSQLEVDTYISKLVNDYETRLSEQKDRIFYLKDQLDKMTKSSDNELVTSLVSAVERAKLIENSSQNIYELESKKLLLLYSKMERLLQDENINNDRSIKQELLSLIQDCRKSLESNLATQKQNIKENSAGDPVKRLLTKMMSIGRVSPQEDVTYIDTKVYEPEKEQTVRTVQIKRQDTKPREVPQTFNNYLEDKTDLNGANFENIMFSKRPKSIIATPLYAYDMEPNETGFDLKEAVNPKEDLDEIMKAFDFYNDTQDDADFFKGE